MGQSSQLILDFPQQADFSPHNFLKMPFNEQAVAAAMALNKGGLVAYGPSGVGKTHLLHVWAAANHAAYLSPSAWPTNFAEAVESGVKKWAVDEVQNLTLAQQEEFFHLINHVKNEGGILLAAADKPVAEAGLMPEVSSRLATYTQAEIRQPEGEDLKALLVKWAADKQWQLGENVVSYLLIHAGRSVSELSDIFNKIDKVSLAKKRRITVPLVKEIIQQS